MEDIRIKATPQALLAGAEDVRGTIANIRKYFSNVESAVNRSSGYWQGDAANAHRAAYREMKGTVDEILSSLEKYSADLRSIAQAYLGVEQENESQAGSLPTDVIL